MATRIYLIFFVLIVSVFYGKSASLEDFSFKESENSLNIITTENNLKKLDNHMKLTDLNSDIKVQVNIAYTVGNRFSGDRLVGQTSKNQSWPVPHNVTVSISYPSSGIGAIVTYVIVTVNQSSNQGRAYVTKGGIHQRYITVVVEAYNTLYMNYNAQVYGL